MPFMKTRERDTLAKYIVQPLKPRQKLDWRDFAIPTKRKRKRRISENVDKIVYGV